MNKILIKLQGKTLILAYHVKPGLVRDGAGWAAYIEVQPSAELSRFDLKGLTPEMFCVNISDMVNLRGLYSGAVENERQAPVALWEMSEEGYRQALDTAKLKLTHRQIAACLEKLPGYVQELDGQFIDFEECVVPPGTADGALASGYRLTVVTEDMGGKTAPYAFYNLDTWSSEGWQSIPPPSGHHQTIREAIAARLQNIREAGVAVSEILDETDYVAGE